MMTHSSLTALLPGVTEVVANVLVSERMNTNTMNTSSIHLSAVFFFCSHTGSLIHVEEIKKCTNLLLVRVPDVLILESI